MSLVRELVGMWNTLQAPKFSWAISRIPPSSITSTPFLSITLTEREVPSVWEHRRTHPGPTFRGFLRDPQMQLAYFKDGDMLIRRSPNIHTLSRCAQKVSHQRQLTVIRFLTREVHGGHPSGVAVSVWEVESRLMLCSGWWPVAYTENPIFGNVSQRFP